MLWHARIFGIVQGVGFRPFVSRLAARFGILGSVANRGSYVEVFAEGEEATLTEFFRAIEREAPERSAILKVDIEHAKGRHFESFEIIESEHEAGAIFVSPDIATCDKCRAELFDPHDRRYLHPFINCTACGPRLTILDSMPYDRERTSMGDFPMCESCREEYESPDSRRYDAQPVCCNDCGPEVYILGGEERGAAAIKKARRALMAGGIVAIKGIGGFHLACDAKNADAVKRLRALKHRPQKPFALMMRDMEAVRRECLVLPGEEEILTGHQKPIILLERRRTGTVTPEVAPDNPKIGIMLPYAPLQMLLFDYPDGLTMTDTLVMTSGNPSGAPIAKDDEDTEGIASFCDLILSHDRKIRLRADDTVMDFFEGEPYMIRRSRGYAPLPFAVGEESEHSVLGIGGELKNTFCLAKGSLFYPSPYIGDLSDLRTIEALKASVQRMSELLEIKPEVCACDLHPRYNATAIAKSLGLPLLFIQHHYAHVLSCLAENDCHGRVLGVSFDGTGYGTDGTIWGGEILAADFAGCERLAHIRPFFQAGGERASREGWRCAVSMLYGLLGDEERVKNAAKKLALADEKELKAQLFMLSHKTNGITSTSAGRLFDAVSAVLGLRRAVTFEGEAAMQLQFAAERYERRFCLGLRGDIARLGLDFSVEPEGAGGALVLPTDALFSYIIKARLAGEEDIEALAFKFHAALAQMIAAACVKLRERTGLTTAALTGGVFQNLLLLRLTQDALRREGFRVLRHHLTAPNDGGIALGQAAAAMYQLNERK